MNAAWWFISGAISMVGLVVGITTIVELSIKSDANEERSQHDRWCNCLCDQCMTEPPDGGPDD